MTSVKHIAIMIEQSHNRLQNSLPVLAQRFDLPPPDLDIPKRYPLDFRRATELERMSTFIEQLSDSPSGNTTLEAIRELVNNPKWTKKQLLDILNGGDHGG